MIFIHSAASATATMAMAMKTIQTPSSHSQMDRKYLRFRRLDDDCCLLQPDNTSRHGMEAGRRRLSIRYRYYYPSVHWQQYAPLLCSPQFLPSSSSRGRTVVACFVCWYWYAGDLFLRLRRRRCLGCTEAHLSDMRRIRYTLDAFTRGAPRTDIALFARVGIYSGKTRKFPQLRLKKLIRFWTASEMSVWKAM